MSATDTESPASGFVATLNSYYEAEQRYVAAGGAKAGADFSEMAAHLHQDVVGRQGPATPYPGEWHGVAGIERFFAVFSETWSSLNLSEIQYFEGEAGLAIQMRMQATAAATGKSLETLVGHFVIFRDGLIREFNVYYYDTVQVLEATRP
ncbi:nuclear transport factor 2 family protein [Sphaerimonospora sp. CA-214678]|uniref:nuclear transport factor 2 family protein n=1 Tax=Sphaerimonospora sp. CA-214678 TaxID=3240029 RepID=UPI003D89BB0B